jgi:hypothetical protein
MATKLNEGTGTESITINVPNTFLRYIRTQNLNRSEYIREAGEQLLDLIEEKLLPAIDCDTDESRIVSISKPENLQLGKIFTLINKNKIIFSRSEFYRMSIFFRIISDLIKDSKLKRNIEGGQEEPGMVKIPYEDEDGNHKFKAYKILKKLDY